MSGNKLKTWSGNLTVSMENSLEVLDLSSNDFADLTRTMFDSPLRNLQSLILDSNGLRSIEDFTFSQLNKLKFLSLKQNVLRSFNDKGLTFSGLQNLQELYLDSNFFSYIPDQEVFQEVQKSLTILSFAIHSRINSVPPLDFPNLRVFNMSYCSLEYVDNFTFVGTSQLQSLDLEGNLIALLAPESLNGLNELKVLRLQQNRFVAFPYRALHPVSYSLKELYLDNNAIFRITSRPTDEILLQNLQYLSLHNTLISSIAEDSFFRHLQFLKFLDISQTRLDRIPKASLAHLTSLEELDISGSLTTE